MQELPFWKAILITIAIIAVAVGLIVGGSLIGLNDVWVAFLALTVWGATGMKMQDAPGIFIGAAYGLLLSLSLEALPDIWGAWAIAIPVVLIILTISCHITGKLTVFCNFSTFAFLTVGGADVILDQRLQLEYLPNLAYGAVLFWIVPWTIMKIRSGGDEESAASS